MEREREGGRKIEKEGQGMEGDYYEEMTKSRTKKKKEENRGK